MSESQLSKGNCHCGKNRFEVELPAGSVTACNCTLCWKKGYLWAFPPEGSIRYLKGGAGTLTTYSSEILKHEFCKICGTGLYGTHTTGPLAGTPGVNVRAILGVNPFRIEVDEVDTRNQVFETTPPVPPELIANPPPAEVEGDGVKIYTGSCHCGKVNIAVKTVPLPQVDRVNEDNCSICVRNGNIGIYPDSAQVTILGREHTTEYRFGRKFNGAPFCTWCGVHVFGNGYGPPQEVVEGLSAEKKEYVRKMLRVQAVNVRALDALEWGELRVDRDDCGTEGYVVPDD